VNSIFNAMCGVGWPALVSTLKDVALGFAAIGTPTIAWIGLRKWRDELRGKANFEVARGLTRATYKLRDEIASARSPLVRGSEYPAGYQVPDANQQGANARVAAEALAHVYQNRWQRVSTALQEFDAQTLEAEALWGADIRESTQALRSCATTLFVSMEAIIDDKAAGGDHFERDRNFGRRMRANAHAAANVTDNELSNQISESVATLEAKLRSHLRRPK
jgi:hypothetical protein